MNANQADAKVRTMCRVLQVSASGYYAWRDRAPSQRAIDNAVLTERIRAVHTESDATYGMPRVRAELIDQGMKVSRQRVARLMRLAHIRGVSRRRAWVVTTRRDKDKQPAPDLVKREFKAIGPNQLWVADMTYVPTWAGFIYLAVVLDVWSRRVVGWAIGESMTAELVLSALNMALQQRKPEGVIDYHGPNRTYNSQRLDSVNLTIDASQTQQRQHARYNSANMCANLKTEMSSTYIRRRNRETCTASCPPPECRRPPGSAARPGDRSACPDPAHRAPTPGHWRPA